MEKESIVIINRTDKITSPCNFIDRLQDYNVKIFAGNNSEFRSMIDSCKYFITKECLPFFGHNEFYDKTISVSWVGESLYTPSPPPYNITGCYKYHFVESQLVPLYLNRGFKRISSLIPKYYMFNGVDRESVCKILGLDSDKKYVTIFTNRFFSFEPKCTRIFNKILGYCKNNNINVVIKNKLKYGNFMCDSKQHNNHFSGDNIFYHQSLLLNSISEFSIGFGSGSALEAECLYSPFINFWHHKKTSGIELENDIGYSGSTYRLCGGSTTYNVHQGVDYDDIKDSLFDFIGLSSKHSFDQKFEIHNIFGV